ncbi:permease prefix domain 1-containing protein [Nocardiopsis kunsanensis]|uniref:permease prefix domain 1-containing protein n=1 Tax=Nocardiopsis kunsanensis TaxID=141693 RepID=UPI000347A284|nr:permease prefix domain 1-containing protein [Nocardiopsis kunsanensis]
MSEAGPEIPTGDTDPVERHVAALDAALEGPARVKARLLAEARDDLAEAVAERTRAGSTRHSAAEGAVAEFGTTEEVVGAWQHELTISQARHTAGAVAITIPFVMACWYLVQQAGPAAVWPLQWSARMLAVNLAGVSGAAALLAAVALAATGTLARRLPTPDEVPLIIAWAATIASLAMAVTTLTLAVAAALGTDWVLFAFAGVLAATSHALVAGSARVCRRCARATAAPR